VKTVLAVHSGHLMTVSGNGPVFLAWYLRL